MSSRVTRYTYAQEKNTHVVCWSYLHCSVNIAVLIFCIEFWLCGVNVGAVQLLSGVYHNLVIQLIYKFLHHCCKYDPTHQSYSSWGRNHCKLWCIELRRSTVAILKLHSTILWQVNISNTVIRHVGVDPTTLVFQLI